MIYANREFATVHVSGDAETIIGETTNILAAVYDFVRRTDGQETADKIIVKIGRNAVSCTSENKEDPNG